MYSYPKGVSFSFIGDTSSSVVLPTVDETENASFSLNTSFGGNITITRTDASEKSTISYTTSNSSNDGVTTEYKYRDLDVTGNGTSIDNATGTLKESTTEDTITKITYSLFYEESSTTVYKKTTTKNDEGSSTTQSTTVNGVETSGSADWPIDLDQEWALEVKDKATVYVFYLGEAQITLTLTSTYSEIYDEDEGSHFYELSGYNVAATSDTDYEVTLTKLDDDTLTVKLKTGSGDTDDDYTTLELNITQIIKVSE